jgi:hypothetical protein
VRDFSNFFNQSDLYFPINEEALFITDEQEPIAIVKDITFKNFFQKELASCIQRNHVRHTPSLG